MPATKPTPMPEQRKANQNPLPPRFKANPHACSRDITHDANSHTNVTHTPQTGKKRNRIHARARAYSRTRSRSLRKSLSAPIQNVSISLNASDISSTRGADTDQDSDAGTDSASAEDDSRTVLPTLVRLARHVRNGDADAASGVDINLNTKRPVGLHDPNATVSIKDISLKSNHDRYVTCPLYSPSGAWGQIHAMHSHARKRTQYPHKHSLTPRYTRQGGLHVTAQALQSPVDISTDRLTITDLARTSLDLGLTLKYPNPNPH